MQRELAELIRREVKDPRVGLVTITAVEVSRDLGHAKVFITVMGADGSDGVEQTLKALGNAAGFLRLQLGRVMNLRSVPQLHFHFDESISRGAHLSALIERAVAEDRLHQDADEPDTKE